MGQANDRHQAPTNELQLYVKFECLCQSLMVRRTISVHNVVSLASSASTKDGVLLEYGADTSVDISLYIPPCSRAPETIQMDMCG